MSVRVLVSDYPHRTLALATETHVLLFKHVQTSGNPTTISRTFTSSTSSSNQRKGDAPRCMVEFLHKSVIDLKGYRTLTTAKGILGLINLGDDVFVCVATGSREIATIRPNESVNQIFAVEFYCINRSDYDHANGYGAGYKDGYREPNPYSNTLFEDEHSHTGEEPMAEHPFMALKKLLSDGSFYYSVNFDLTRRLQDRADADSTLDIASLDQGLLWNSYMINPLLSFRNRLSEDEREALDHSTLLTSVIRGYVGAMTVPQSASPLGSQRSNYPATLTVISRLSARRAGTRFNARGVDDDGNVANFVETETIFWAPTGICFSYVQVRGSIPIFWESQSTLIPGQQKIQITRSPEATQLSFDRHFEGLAQAYGVIHVINLLSETKPGEVELTDRYNLHLAKSSLLRRESLNNGEGMLESRKYDLLRKTEFDFHEQSRGPGGYEGAKRIKPLIADSAESFVYFLTQEIEDDVAGVENGKPVHKKTRRPVTVMIQNGVFRSNCLDCLDRTNLVQGIISQTALELFLEHRGDVASSSNLSIFWMRHSTLWADNGDALSKIYAGTGALKSSFTRHGKMSLGGLMADARKSATRLYVNHFEDKGRQNTTDLLLGRLVGQEEVELLDPVADWVQERLRQRAEEFESSETVRVWVGTYNLNGKRMSYSSELRKWLDVRRGEGFDIVVIGFQEIVELSPSQIMNTDPNRRIEWEQAVKQSINEKGDKAEDQYILLRTGQLVGAALLIFVKVSVLSKIKNVEGAIKKTGVSGLAGNKGAVAIRMDVQGSSICFVTAHLAAGFGNYDERNRDYATIVNGLRFQRDRKIEDHEVVIWAGDFNYRIGTQLENARELIDICRSSKMQGAKAEEALQSLYRHDQLNIQMVAGQTFPFYQEGAIKFLPTYKFDLGNDNYDSSEKARIPAWTDRILYKVDATRGTDMRQTEYTSVMNLRFSDHRPVYSTFSVTVRVIDEERKKSLLRQLYAKRTKQLRENRDDESDSSQEADELMGYQSVAPGLPPASSDKRKWWLDGDKLVASQVRAPKEGMVLNPDRNGNPWKEGGEDDWIMIDVAKEKAHPKPQPPAPRKGSSRAQSQALSTANVAQELEERGTRTPPRPPPSRSSRAETPPLKGNISMAGALPASRNVSTASSMFPPPRPSPPPSAPRSSLNRNASTATRSPGTRSILDSDISADPPTTTPSLARTASQASTASSSTTSRKPVPQRPAKPSTLSAQPTATSINSQKSEMRSLSPRPESGLESERAPSPVSGLDGSCDQNQDLRNSTRYHALPPPSAAKPKPVSSIASPHSVPPAWDRTSNNPNRNTSTATNTNEAMRTDTNREKTPPPLPRRTNTSTSLASNASGPPLPPRRAPTQDLLAESPDAEEGGSKSNMGREWKPLLPSR